MMLLHECLPHSKQANPQYISCDNEIEIRGARATEPTGAAAPLSFAYEGTRGQPCALCYHYNILYLNIIYEV